MIHGTLLFLQSRLCLSNHDQRSNQSPTLNSTISSLEMPKIIPYPSSWSKDDKQAIENAVDRDYQNSTEFEEMIDTVGRHTCTSEDIQISCAYDVSGLKPYCNVLAIYAGEESGFNGLERDIKLDKSDGKPVKSILVNPETSRDSHTKRIIRTRA